MGRRDGQAEEPVLDADRRNAGGPLREVGDAGWPRWFRRRRPMPSRPAVVVLLVAGLALAAPPKKRPARPSPPSRRLAPAPAPAPAAVAPPATPVTPAAAPGGEPTNALLERTAGLYAALEYDGVIPLAEQVLARPDLSLAQKLEAYRLLGSAKAIVEDPAEAEKPFRLLLRARADFDLAPNTPPKILAVFRKVQLEERALADQLREVERERIVGGLRLLGAPPSTARGGRPLPLSFRLRDATGAVEVVRVPYRRQGTSAFSTLALERSADGDWRGLIPAEFTSDEKGFRMEYYVETADVGGPLLRLGTAQAPLGLDVTAGTIAQARPPPLPRWAFFTAASLAVASGAAAGGLGAAFHSAQAGYRQQLEAGGVVDGALLVQQRAQGEQLATATNGALIAFGVTALATAVLAPLTDFHPEGQ